MKNIKCAIVGATGVAGQQFIEALADHPWFQISGLYASERSAGKKYADSCVWHSSSPLDGGIKETIVRNAGDLIKDIGEYDIIFSALPSGIARSIEGECAKYIPVISTTSAYRYDKNVPIVIPEINADHLALIKAQKSQYGWSGFVVPGPNCTVMGLAISLKPLYDNFGIDSVVMTSLQAVSGAGYPGVPSLDITDNIIPYIPGEEDKVVKETAKILGAYQDGEVIDANFGISCICTRVPVIDGHTEAVYVKTKEAVTAEKYKKAIAEFNERFRKNFGDLPSAPEYPIVVMEEPNRPQPRLDRDAYAGMATIIGRIQEDPIVGGIKYIVLSHNTKKGAAKGGILVAEYLHSKGILKGIL